MIEMNKEICRRKKFRALISCLIYALFLFTYYKIIQS